VAEQRQLGFLTHQVLPFSTFARKNIGYVYAIKKGAKKIINFDDDNFIATRNLHSMFPQLHQSHHLQKCITDSKNPLAINPYPFFGLNDAWPRGFPINHLRRNVMEDYFPCLNSTVDLANFNGVAQIVADIDPDLDSIYRMT